jgi:hypothetical protein
MTRLATPVILLAIIGIAYWYWSGPYEDFANTAPVDDPKENAEVMQLCIEHEDREEGLSGNLGSAGEDPEGACAKKIGLYQMDGEWHHIL